MYFIIDLIVFSGMTCTVNRLQPGPWIKSTFWWLRTASDPAEMNGSSLVVKQMYGNLAAVSGAAFGRDGVMLRFEFSFWAWGDRDRRCSSAWSFICFLSPLHLYVCDLFWCSFASAMLSWKEAALTSSILLVYQAPAFTQWHNYYSSLIPVLLRSCRALREKREENCP